MKLDMIGLNVHDMKKTVGFYELIGLNVTYGTYTDDYVEIGNESIRISLNSKEMLGNLKGENIANTPDKCELAFLCDNKDEVDYKIEILRNNDIEILLEPFDAPWGQYYAMVKDLDGYIISFFVNKK